MRGELRCGAGWERSERVGSPLFFFSLSPRFFILLAKVKCILFHQFDVLTTRGCPSWHTYARKSRQNARRRLASWALRVLCSPRTLAGARKLHDHQGSFRTRDLCDVVMGETRHSLPEVWLLEKLYRRSIVHALVAFLLRCWLDTFSAHYDFLALRDLPVAVR